MFNGGALVLLVLCVQLMQMLNLILRWKRVKLPWKVRHRIKMVLFWSSFTTEDGVKRYFSRIGRRGTLLIYLSP